jgi:hypothetical protein
VAATLPLLEAAGTAVAFARTTLWFPMGQPLELKTNSQGIAEAAAAMWSPYPRSADAEPFRIRIEVEDHDAETKPVPALPMGDGNLITITHGPDNHAWVDLTKRWAFATLTRDVAADVSYVVHYFLEPLSNLLLGTVFGYAHAAGVALEGRAALLCGESGAGKTCLAYACARAGWEFLSGDAIQIDDGARNVSGRPYWIRFRETAQRQFPELRRFSPKRRANGKLDLELSTAALGIRIAHERAPGCVVFLNREEGLRQPSVEQMRRQDAYAILSQPIRYGDKEYRERQRTRLRELLERPILRMTYGDLGEAEPALRRVIKESE